MEEIDKEATESGIKAMQEDDRLIMDITRTGSTWTRSAADWAGQTEDKRCQICMEADESAEHFWVRKGLKQAREEAWKPKASENDEAAAEGDTEEETDSRTTAVQATRTKAARKNADVKDVKTPKGK